MTGDVRRLCHDIAIGVLFLSRHPKFVLFGLCLECLSGLVYLHSAIFVLGTKCLLLSFSGHHFYDESKPFTCLDGSATIAFDRVNDDYCDCKDGSDEPGKPHSHTLPPPMKHAAYCCCN